MTVDERTQAAQDRTLQDKLGDAPDAKAPVRLELRLLTCTHLIEQRLGALFRETFETTLARFDFLAALDRKGELSLGQVSRLLMVSNGNVTGLATRLRQDGLIEDAPNRGDRRAQYVRLSANGARQFKKMAKAHEGWVESMFADLDDQDREDLMRLLDRAKHSLRREANREDHL
jgi:DNA-binding MarR family transcriptional regulator